MKCISVFTVLASVAVGQQMDKPRQLDPLVNVELKILDGEFRPAHSMHVNGQDVNIPDGCAFRIALPFGRRAIGFESQGEPAIDKDRGICQQAFKLGLPSRFANRPNGGSRVQPLSAGDAHNTQVDWYVQWIDPVYIPVSWTQVDVWVKWFEGGLFCNEASGGGFLDGCLSTTGWTSLGQTGVGYIDGCSTAGYTGNAIHMNSAFPPCTPINPMFLSYEPSRVTVDSDGTAYGYAYTYTSGGACRLLLRVYPTNGVLTRFDS